MSRMIPLFLFLSLLSCTSIAPTASRQFTATEGQALLTLYLTTSGRSSGSLAFTLSDIAVFADGAWVTLGLPEQQIERRMNVGRQLLLGVALAPLGELRRIRFRVSAVKVDGKLSTAPPDDGYREVVLSTHAGLKMNDSECLFLDWKSDPAELFPRFSAWGQQPVLGAGLAYFLCDDISTVYVVRTDRNEVVSAFSLPGPLGEMRIDRRSRKLYILSTGRRALFVYDCVKSRLLEQIDLPRTIAPKYLTLATDAGLAFVTDPESSQVLKVELRSGAVTAQQLSAKPGKIIYSTTDIGTLAILAPEVQKVFLLKSRSLKTKRTLTVGLFPDSIRFFSDGLAVSEKGAGKVSVYSVQSGRLISSVPVGRQPADLVLVGNNQLLVTNSGGASLSVLYPGQKTSSLRIPTMAMPSELEYLNSKKLLYIASYQNKQVSVVEMTGYTQRKQVFLGGTPLTLAVLE